MFFFHSESSCFWAEYGKHVFEKDLDYSVHIYINIIKTKVSALSPLFCNKKKDYCVNQITDDEKANTSGRGSVHPTVPSQTGSSCKRGRATSSSVAQNKKITPIIETAAE